MTKYFRDPIHGEIKVPGEFLDIIDKPVFQRLRGVKQVGLADLVYPGATHTRFLHSLGVFHISRYLKKPLVSLYALVHDVGHPPFSHVVESALHKAGKKFDHDKHLFSYARKLVSGTVFSVNDLKNAIEKGHWIHGDLGADRLDYIIRDGYFTGVNVGSLDWKRLLRLIRIRRGKLIIHPKAIDLVEQFFVSRFILGSAVYMHKTNLIAEELVTKAVSEILNDYSVREIVSRDDVGLIELFKSNENSAFFWNKIENRELFKRVFKSASKEDAEEIYEKLVAKFGEKYLVFGDRSRWHKPVEVWLSTGEHLLEASPLINSLVEADKKKQYYFIAVDRSILRRVNKLLK